MGRGAIWHKLPRRRASHAQSQSKSACAAHRSRRGTRRSGRRAHQPRRRGLCSRAESGSARDRTSAAGWRTTMQQAAAELVGRAGARPGPASKSRAGLMRERHSPSHLGLSGPYHSMARVTWRVACGRAEGGGEGSAVVAEAGSGHVARRKQVRRAHKQRQRAGMRAVCWGHRPRPARGQPLTLAALGLCRPLAREDEALEVMAAMFAVVQRGSDARAARARPLCTLSCARSGQ